MEPEGSSPNSHVTATCPYPEPARSSLYPPSHFLNIHLNIILPSMPGWPKWSLSLTFPYQNPVHSPPPYTLHAPPHVGGLRHPQHTQISSNSSTIAADNSTV